MAEHVLDIQRLKMRYRSGGRTVYALQNADLAVRTGEAVAIAGESGSGKSTLARAAMGLLPRASAQIDGGIIRLEGRDVTRASDKEWARLRGRPAAMVFQDPLSFLNPVVPVGTQVAESVRRHDRTAQVRARVAELLDLVRLPGDVSRKYAHELSGGMRQRALLAIALGCGPRLLIADEPTTALDVTTQAEIMELLSSLRRRLGMGLLLITHDLGLVRSYCDRVYVMYAGHTIEHGRVDEIFAAPSHPYTKGLIAASRLIPRADGLLNTIGGDVPALRRPFRHCPFVPRCDERMDVCGEALPALNHSTDLHSARCWLVQDAAEEFETDGAA